MKELIKGAIQGIKVLDFTHVQSGPTLPRFFL